MKTAVRLLLILAGAYALLVVAAYLGQRWLLYLPDVRPPPAGRLQDLGLARWPSAGDYRGLVATSAPDPVAGTVVVFHGNAGAAWQRQHYLEALGRLGYRVVLAEYPGYGGREGRLGEKEVVADARATVRLAFEAYGAPLFLWGESLGAGVAAAVAADPPAPLAGIVLLTPWDSLTALAQARYWFLPVRWLLRDRYDSVANLRAFAGPVAVLLAEQDEVIPVRHGRRLYASLQEPRRLWVFAGAGHNGWRGAPAEAWWGEVMDFVAGAEPAGKP